MVWALPLQLDFKILYSSYIMIGNGNLKLNHKHLFLKPNSMSFDKEIKQWRKRKIWYVIVNVIRCIDIIRLGLVVRSTLVNFSTRSKRLEKPLQRLYYWLPTLNARVRYKVSIWKWEKQEACWERRHIHISDNKSKLNDKENYANKY